MPDNELTVPQVAAELGLSVWAVYKLIKGGKLKARKFGVQFAINPADLDAVRVRHKGRPYLADAKPESIKRRTVRASGSPAPRPI